MADITGRATVRKNGVVLAADNAVTVNPGGISRTFERHGGRKYTREEEVNPTCRITILHDSDADLVALANIKDATIEVECNTGQTYVLRGADNASPGPLDTGTGKVEIDFEADSFDKL